MLKLITTCILGIYFAVSLIGVIALIDAIIRTPSTSTEMLSNQMEALKIMSFMLILSSGLLGVILQLTAIKDKLKGGKNDN